MALISTIKSILGMGESGRSEEETSVTVEREPDAGSERAVKEPVSGEGDTEVTEPEDDTDEAASGGDSTTGEPDTGTGEPVEEIDGIGPAYAERLADAGVETVADLADADAADLAEATGLGEGRVGNWIERARAR